MKFLFTQNSLSLYCGEARSFDLDLNEPNSTTPYNLEGKTVYLAVRKLIDDEYTVLDKSSSDNTQISLLNPRAGTIRVFFKTVDTATKTPGVYTYDCWVEDDITLDRFPSIAVSEFELKKSVFRK